MSTLCSIQQALMQLASTIQQNEGHISFDISNYPYQITNIRELKGKSGYISFNKITIDSFEREEHVFFTGFLEDGTQLDEDTLSKMFRLSTSEHMFLASEEARFITGFELIVDGGRRLATRGTEPKD